MKPLIGVTMSGRQERDVSSGYYDDFYSIPAQYLDAVRRAGGLPVLIPNGDDWRDIVPMLHGVIVTGGADVDPACYGGNTSHQQLTRLVPDRDSTELALTRHIIEATELPSLFICRGMQVLNVALGGTLYEHLPDVIEVDIHRGDDGFWNRHAIQVDAASTLAEVMESTQVETVSGHHQAVKALGEGLQVIATAPDGVVEAIELTIRDNLLAVQWHPEVSAKEDHTQQRLFNWLVWSAS